MQIVENPHVVSIVVRENNGHLFYDHEFVERTKGDSSSQPTIGINTRSDQRGESPSTGKVVRAAIGVNKNSIDSGTTLSIAPAQFADLEAAMAKIDADPAFRRERVAAALGRMKRVKAAFDSNPEQLAAKAESAALQRIEEERASALADLKADEAEEVLAALKRNTDRAMTKMKPEMFDIEGNPKDAKRLERETEAKAKPIEREIRTKYREREKAIEAKAKQQEASAKAQARIKGQHEDFALGQLEAIAQMEAIVSLLPPSERKISQKPRK